MDEVNYKSKGTYKDYFSDLNQFAKHLGYNEVFDIKKDTFESLTATGLSNYLAILSQECKEDGTKKYMNSTINRKLSAIKSIMKWLSDYGAIDFRMSSLNVVKRLPRDTKEINMIPLQTLLDYIEYAKTMPNGNEKSLLMMLGLETGLRAKELLGLKWSQFQVDGKVVTIMSDTDNMGKGNKEFLDKISITVYDRLREGLNTESSKLFSISYETANRTMGQLNKHFGNESFEYSFHSIKKTCVTMVYRRTGCIVQAQKKARHASIETTRIYLRVEDIEITGVVSLMDNTDENAYKNAEEAKLKQAIESLPYEMRLLLNDKLGEM